MTTPDVLTAPANAPANHPSVAEAVLAEAQAAHAPDAPDAPDIEPSMVAAMEATDPRRMTPRPGPGTCHGMTLSHRSRRTSGT